MTRGSDDRKGLTISSKDSQKLTAHLRSEGTHRLMNRLKLSRSFFALITAGAALFALGGTAFSQQFSDVSVAAGLHRDADQIVG
jgi:hypothetical protein